MMIYGLSTCAICQKARKALEAEGMDVSFRDVRAEPLSEAELAEPDCRVRGSAGGSKVE